MAKCIMIQGTCSNAGKSVLTAGLCGIFSEDGYRTAPFKSQNMALNSFVTKDGLEMGRAQVMQAECAGREPDVRMNPILLKPTSDQGSQVIVNGTSIGNMSASDYFEYKKALVPEVMNAYESLAAENDIIVIEGAGSPAEINLMENDIVNMGLAEMVDAPVILVGDIDRGGVFASLYGTAMLLPEVDRARIKGLVINKFRGDGQLLKPGLDMLTELIKIPTLGVVPYFNLDLDDEDSLSERLNRRTGGGQIDIAIIRLPRISNFTDFNPLMNVPEASVRYVEKSEALGNPDLIILPGSKNTMEDLRWLRENGLEGVVKDFVRRGGPVLGICGGFQMLGQRIADPHNAESGGSMDGMGLLNIETVFGSEKVRRQVTGEFLTVGGILSGLSGRQFEGYEIHMGNSDSDCPEPIIKSVTIDGLEATGGAWNGNVAGCYVHGIFDNGDVVNGLMGSLCARKGIPYIEPDMASIKDRKAAEYRKLTEHLRKSLNLREIYKIMGMSVNDK